MKKNYIILVILLLSTVVITLFLASLYNNKSEDVSFAYETLNKIKSDEFEEYLVENPDVIFYIGNKDDSSKNKFEKKFVKKLQNLNLFDLVVYIEKQDITSNLKQILNENYKYNYNDENLPIIIVISDGGFSQVIEVINELNVDSAINYEVFR